MSQPATTQTAAQPTLEPQKAPAPETRRAAAAALPARLPVRRGVAPRPATTGWTLETFAGRLVEFSTGRSGGALTLAIKLLREAQLSGEPTAWIGRPEGSFFPPDAVVAGVDLAALPVIEPRKPMQAFKAADRLLRSGAFGLIVVDFARGVRMPIAAQTRLAGLTQKHGTALVCLTEKETTEASLGSLVSLRAQITRQERMRTPAPRTSPAGAGLRDGVRPSDSRAPSVRQIVPPQEASGRGVPDSYVAGRERMRTGRDGVRSAHGVRARVIKDKQRGPGWEHAESFGGPPGLR